MIDQRTAVDDGEPTKATGEMKYTALGRAVAKQASQLQRGYLNDESWAVAALAKLRRGVGREPGEVVELLAWTIPGVYVEDFRSDRISDQERASHLALTLYAMHQQSHRDKHMHREKPTLGDAARQLRIDLGEHGEAGVLRRFNAIGTATGFEELARHSRGLIQQLRAAGVALDYGLFADDLCKLMDPQKAVAVRNRWGRHFHRRGSTEKAASVTETP